MNMLRKGNFPLIRLNELNPDKLAVKLLPEEIARSQMAVPLWLDGDDLVIACADPSDLDLIKEVETTCRRVVKPLKASFSDIRSALDRFYWGETAEPGALDFGEILFNLGYLSPEKLEQLRSLQAGSGKSAMQICREHTLVSDENFAEAAGVFCSKPYFRLRELDFSIDLSVLIPWEMATRRKVIPLMWLSGILIVATPELQPGERLQDISDFLGLPIQPVLCSFSEWDRFYRHFYLRGTPDRHQKDLENVQWLNEHDVVPGLDPDVIKALAFQTDRPLEEILISKEICSRPQWLRAQSEISKMELVSEWKEYHKGVVDRKELACLLPHPVATRFSILPLKLEGDRLIIAVSEPDPAVIKLVEGFTRLAVHAYLLTPEEIQQQLDNLYKQTPSHNAPMISEMGELLQKSWILTKEQLEEIQSVAAGSNLSLEEEIISAGYMDEIDLVETLSLQTGIPYIHLDHVYFHETNVTQLPASIASAHTMVPIWSTSTELWVAIADPFDVRGLMKAEQSTGKRIWIVLAPRSTISAALERLLGYKGKSAPDPRVLNLLRKLVKAGLLSQIGATQALHEFDQEKLSLDKAIANASHHPLIEIARAIGKIIGLPFVDLQLKEEIVTKVDPLGKFYEKVIIHDPIDEQAAHLLSLQDAQHFSAIPVSINADHVVVAFADPNFEQDLEQLKSKITKKIVPVITFRDDLESAIQRILGKRNIGNYLLLDGLITRSQLNNALDFARNTGVRIGKALVNRGYITDNQLYRYLAKQTSFPFYDLAAIEINKDLAQSIPSKTAREFGILPIQDTGDQVILGIVDPFNSEALTTAKELLGKEINPVLITENALDKSLENLYSQEYLAQSISELLDRNPEDSAYKVLSRAQIICIILFLLISVIWIFSDFSSYIILINALSTIFYITFSIYRFNLIYRALSHSMEITVTPEDLKALDDRDLPVYTILVPVFNEAGILPELLGALKKLDYPTTKLDIQILMEQDDQGTIDAFYNWSPPSHFHGIVVPYGEPKTKPKACNYGLIHARGDYVVIFDAEDIPQPDQLKKVIVAFSKSSPQVACIQSKLNYYNSEQNLLTRWFTVEYSMWFDLFLPGLSATSAPIPLGGTSNHFKKDTLIEIGAWDPYNVTEDADLGVRLFKRGYKTAIVDSTTFEEANSQVHNWIRQRSRWIKGYIQTWLVHMRHPLRLIREIGIKGFFSFQFVVGGTFFAALINPIYWMLTTLWFLSNWKFIQVIFPGIIFIMGALCLFIGNFAFTYMNVAGALRRGYYSMVKVALISPIYWALASVGAWVGFIQLLYKPHFWEKTIHGLYTEPKKEEATQQQ